MATVNQGMSVEEIKQIVAQRVTNAIETIAIYEAQTNIARKSLNQAKHQEDKVGFVAYKLELPRELSRVHNTFHVSNLKKCHADEPLAVLLDGLHIDDKLQFVEEPIEITD
ncbi:hypothetical protein Tco_1513331 [Tanacetum coccineum]